MKAIEWTYNSGLGGWFFSPANDYVILRFNYGYGLYKRRADGGLDGVTLARCFWKLMDRFKDTLQ